VRSALCGSGCLYAWLCGSGCLCPCLCSASGLRSGVCGSRCLWSGGLCAELCGSMWPEGLLRSGCGWPKLRRSVWQQCECLLQQGRE